MIIKDTTDTLPKELFRITKTDIKKALKATLSTNVYKLVKASFQDTLDYYYSSLRYSHAKIAMEMGEIESVLVVYVWCHIDVTFHKILKPLCYASNYQNTTSDDFIYTLMNTLIPIMESEGTLSKVRDIDAFED